MAQFIMLRVEPCLLCSAEATRKRCGSGVSPMGIDLKYVYLQLELYLSIERKVIKIRITLDLLQIHIIYSEQNFNRIFLVIRLR